MTNPSIREAVTTPPTESAAELLERMGVAEEGICTRITQERVYEVTKVAALAISEINDDPEFQKQLFPDQSINERVEVLVTGALQALLADDGTRRDITDTYSHNRFMQQYYAKRHPQRRMVRLRQGAAVQRTEMFIRKLKSRKD